MTNGEKILSMFPSMNFGTLAQDDVIVNKDYANNDEPQVFIPKRVWNAEYKEPKTDSDCDSCKYQIEVDGSKCYECVKGIRNNYTTDSEVAEKKQEPKQGHWIKSRDWYGNNHFICSECGNDIVKQFAGDLDDNYCSMCGAKMESEVNE